MLPDFVLRNGGLGGARSGDAQVMRVDLMFLKEEICDRNKRNKRNDIYDVYDPF